MPSTRVVASYYIANIINFDLLHVAILITDTINSLDGGSHVRHLFYTDSACNDGGFLGARGTPYCSTCYILFGVFGVEVVCTQQAQESGYYFASISTCRFVRMFPHYQPAEYGIVMLITLTACISKFQLSFKENLITTQVCRCPCV